MQSSEQTVHNAGFGAITDRRVMYQSKSLMGLGGGSKEDIPLRHITSVGLATARHPIWGLLFGIAGVGSIFVVKGAVGVLLGVVLLGLALLLMWGSPQVILSTAGQDRRFVSGPPWTRSEAEQFVSQLRSQLFKDADATSSARWG
ncbi:MAG: DUF6232 family protein [Thermomicrobiales bacterium]